MKSRGSVFSTLATSSKRASPIAQVHVSDRGHFGFTRLTAKRHGLAALGYVTDARTLGNVLNQFLADPGAPLETPEAWQEALMGVKRTYTFWKARRLTFLNKMDPGRVNDIDFYLRKGLQQLQPRSSRSVRAAALQQPLALAGHGAPVAALWRGVW